MIKENNLKNSYNVYEIFRVKLVLDLYRLFRGVVRILTE